MATAVRVLAVPAFAGLVVLALVATRAPSAGAAVDLTGDWTYTMSGDYEGSCAVQLTQTGEDLTGSFDCAGTENDGTLDGTVTQVGNSVMLAGQVTLHVGDIDIIGWSIDATVYPAGNTLNGHWQSEDEAGTLVGLRNVPIYIKGDLNCDGDITGLDVLSGLRWTLDLDPLQQPDCPEIESDLGVVFGDIDCDLQVDTPDGFIAMYYLAGLPLDLGTDCPAIGTTFSPVIPT